MKKLMGCGLVLLLVAALGWSQSPGNVLTGRLWVGMTDQEKMWAVVGWHSCLWAWENTNEAFRMTGRFSEETAELLQGITSCTDGFSVGDMVRKVDQFYWVRENLDVPFWKVIFRVVGADVFPEEIK